MKSSRILTADYRLRVAEVLFDKGGVAKFDITGTDLGNGFTDTSCHAAWYTDGVFQTSYNGGEAMTRQAEVGCAHPTDPEGPTIYPTGQARVECTSEWGRILFIEQLDKSLPFKFSPWTFDGAQDFGLDTVVIRANGIIKYMRAGSSLPAPKRTNLALTVLQGEF